MVPVYLNLFLSFVNFWFGILLYSHVPYHNDTMIKDEWRLLYKNIYLSIYLQCLKGLLKVCVWEGAGDRTETAIFWPHSYGRQRCVFLVLQMLNRRPWGPLCWVMAFFTASYQQLIWTPTHQGPKAPSAWCGFPYHISSITPSPTVTATVLTSVLTELYNSSTSTQSPTRSLKWHDWSSSSGNNCHAVHTSLSSGASVYGCTMGIFFTSSHLIS